MSCKIMGGDLRVDSVRSRLEYCTVLSVPSTDLELGESSLFAHLFPGAA